MDNITTTLEDLLEEEQKDKTSHITSCTSTGAPDSKLGFKALSSSSSSQPLPPPPPLDLEKRNSAPAGISRSKDLHFMLAQIRSQYLQARPMQQIKELRSLLEKIIGSQEGVLIRTTTSTGDQEVGSDCGGASTVAVDLSSKGKKCTSCSSNTCYPNAGKVVANDGGGGMKGDLDEVGNKTGEEDGKVCGNKITTTTDTTKTTASCGSVRRKVGGSGTVGEDETERECASSSITHEEQEEDMHDEILIGLHDLTIGYNPPPSLAAEGEQTLLEVNPEKATEHGSFLHPPIYYRLSFVKYIIKQLEWNNWSVPQGSNEKDGEDPVEQKALLLEKWYDSLESLSNSSRQMLSEEPFYRLYEIKVAHHNRKGSSETIKSSSIGGGSRGKQAIVKIFEHESSFVADGTTGLVTWKASTEFLKWLTSVDDEQGKLLLSKFGEGKEIEWILELGCGCGFLAVGMCKCIAGTLQQYIATDGSLAALEKAKFNVEVNFTDKDEQIIKNRIKFEKVNWENEATRESFTQLVDGMTCIYGADNGLLLGADIVYDPERIPDVVGLITDFLETKAGIAILACTIRNEATTEVLKKTLDSQNLLSRTCGRWEDGEIIEIKLPS